MTFTFPPDFLWGTATASYQVEGAVHEDGRTPSIWDTFCERSGAIADGSSGAVACDQYHRYREDIELMQELGVGAYRLSISWSRIIPEYKGPVNDKGVQHYRRVLQALRDAHIRPVVTLYHWDLPQYLQDRGGWAARETAEEFGRYADVLARELGELVDTWTTLNEPWCSAYLGYGSGVHAPGIQDYGQTLAAAHHLNLAHGLAAQAIRRRLGDEAKVSVTLNLQVCRAGSDSPADMRAKEQSDLFANEIWLGPMFDGRYDPRLLQFTEGISDWAFVHHGDMETIRQPMDSLGINYYSTMYVRQRERDLVTASARPAGPYSSPMPAQEGVEVLPPEGQLTAMGWNQEPEGLRDLLVEMAKRYPGLQLMVTENGSAWDDTVENGGSPFGGEIVHDPRRVTYLEEHIKAVAEAIDEGAPVAGYFAWSLLDNFEWSLGYSKRFGILRVNYDNQERIWKDSGLRFREIVRGNAI
ncbi:GH1 family beta-glucosidase [Bifidobacterium crudilactis]|jgi:beta-glucosidase|uniref:GH1 family beta-glucosidase n=1 Tax=Bifidobacterium crudilactis TaxID=327277 RepID=UPI0023520156|nr:GH1 family beta-glucosidase [Bifidobacterium crudilactis]MCI1218659.1 GH1 family beta-glucosidase [Bifidobacterium crudilactis]